MQRRSFFKSLAIFPLVCLDDKKKDEGKNILENATVQIFLPFSLSSSHENKIGLFAMNKPMRKLRSRYLNSILGSLRQWGDQGIMLHFHGYESTMYNVEVDKMLCNEKLASQFLYYPTIKLFDDQEELFLPSMSLLTTMKHPSFSNTDSTIMINGDLEYFDMNKIGKIVNLKKYKQTTTEPNFS